MIHKHTELEIKLDASDISPEQFLPWAFAKVPTEYLRVVQTLIARGQH
jgi:hypothetical protein